MFRSGKALEDNLHSKSSGAKFISRTQIRTFASASSVNASSGQVTHNDNRLSESEAIDEVKQLAIQLQRLNDRIPRGPISNVILTLLDICKSVQQSNNQLTLKPPTQTVQGTTKKLSICDPNFVEKETNTSLENLIWEKQKQQKRQIYCQNGCKYIISENCDNHIIINCNNNHKNSSKNRCCNGQNQDQTKCSTNSINFDNLQLQCMCSSDNNSVEDEEYQIENCDNCHSSFKTQADPNANGGGSFRERLVNQIVCSHDRPPLGPRLSQNSNQQKHSTSGNSNTLMKRKSELMLGTANFPDPAIGRKTYESCDNIFVNKQSISESVSRVKMNSNYSLSYEASGLKAWEPSNEAPPPMKLSLSEDDNLKELKIALSSTLTSANGAQNSNCPPPLPPRQTQRLINSAKPIQQPQSYTSSSSSSKNDKISLSLSNSSTSDAVTRKLQQQSINDNELENSSSQAEEATAGTEKLKLDTGEQPTNTDTKNHNNASSSPNKNQAEQPPNGNNLSHNNKKRKTPDGKLVLDLNDRSKYGEEVSV